MSRSRGDKVPSPSPAGCAEHRGSATHNLAKPSTRRFLE